MKRTLSLLLAFVMVLGLAACGGNTAQETTPPAPIPGLPPVRTAT